MTGRRQYTFEQALLPNENGCLEWTRGRSRSGYGAYRGQQAHRFAYERAHGEIPKGLLVCHRCDNRLCCNPEHLFLGTHADNWADMVSKGRQGPPLHCPPERKLRGERHAAAKLTEAQAREIIGSAEKATVLARKYGVCHQTISLIRNGKNWGHIPRPPAIGAALRLAGASE